ncbi:hypothetical protein MTP99_005257 [Tenebrio molitor]|nr:hypothetical protein MTP99_005257 [Tenebrio molitor]
MEENVLSYGTMDEAYDLLQNGILVETSKGLVCMSLSDAISSSDLNLSVEDLKNVATELISQQNVEIPDKICLKTDVGFVSGGFVAESLAAPKDPKFVLMKTLPCAKIQDSKPGSTLKIV